MLHPDYNPHDSLWLAKGHHTEIFRILGRVDFGGGKAGRGEREGYWICRQTFVLSPACKLPHSPPPRSLLKSKKNHLTCPGHTALAFSIYAHPSGTWTAVGCQYLNMEFLQEWRFPTAKHRMTNWGEKYNKEHVYQQVCENSGLFPLHDPVCQIT